MSILDKTDEIAITLPDGSVKTFTGASVTGQQIAASIGNRLAAAALAVKIDGKLSDLDLPIERNASVQIVTRESPEAPELIRHDAAHVIAEAVQELYPGTQVTIGPAIENGFYYDFARDEPFTTDDLAKIEAKMREIIARNAPFTREVWDRDVAIEYFKNKGEKYKAEIIADLPGTEQITIYKQGEWLDLCRGPHMPSTGQVGDAFKLTKVAGAYWRGDHRNAMLQRIYGVAFRNKKELDAYLLQMEEAEKRDHRKLGKEMDLFHLQEESPGAVFWHPKGWTLWMALENYIRRRMLPEGYDEVRTPQLIDSSLFKASGHWEFYAEKMFKTVEDGEGGRVYGLKPMNCPGHVQIFKQGLKSYRDLPIRYAEFTPLHRNETSGSLHGLLRVRAMSQDDAHIFCTMDQIQSEALRYFDLNLSIYRDLGFNMDRINTKLALRPDERGGTEEGWNLAENGLRIALRSAGIEFEEVPNEGAFYGPKVEFHLTDAIGRQWQCGTLQLDFVLPERLDASYIGEDGAKHRPVMLHRAALGSLERFIGILIEHYAGKFPLWLAPLQVVVATITDEASAYAEEVRAALHAAGIRVEADLRNEKINYKVREHSLAKVPIMLVVGKREAENRHVAMRRMDVAEQPVLPLDQVVMDLVKEAKAPG